MIPANQPDTNQSLRIFLIRHGRPLVSREGLFGLADARQYSANYDAAAVEEFDRTMAGIEFDPLPPIFCSTLERSRDTARKLFGTDAGITEDFLFREFERSVLGVPFLKLPIKWWLAASRALWFIGLRNRKVESFGQARKRARKAAEKLIGEAEKNGQVVLVAHGFLNYFIGRALRQQGWKNVRKAGRGFLGIGEWVKVGK